MEIKLCIHTYVHIYIYIYIYIYYFIVKQIMNLERLHHEKLENQGSLG